MIYGFLQVKPLESYQPVELHQQLKRKLFGPVIWSDSIGRGLWFRSSMVYRYIYRDNADEPVGFSGTLFSDKPVLVAGSQFVVEIGILVAYIVLTLSRASSVHQISNVCLAANGGIAWYSPLDESISHIVDGTHHNIPLYLHYIHKNRPEKTAGKIHVLQIR